MPCLRSASDMAELAKTHGDAQECGAYSSPVLDQSCDQQQPLFLLLHAHTCSTPTVADTK